MYKISVVVSTWRRPEILRKVLLALVKQTLSKDAFEVLVVDSDSGDTTTAIVQSVVQTSTCQIRLYNCDVNVISAKRNMGVNYAVGQYVVFLDDDCIPDENHLESFLRVSSNHKGEDVVWCGGVRFSHDLVEKSNYYRYRNDCHFSVARPRKNNLNFNQVVTMNMMIEADVLKRNQIKFDERFVGYGCEDLEFGWRLTEQGFTIKPCSAEIEHEELGGSISKFKEKIFRASVNGFLILQFVAPNLIDHLGSTKMLEVSTIKLFSKGWLKHWLLLAILDSNVPNLVERFLLRFDSVSWLYSHSLYRLVLAAAHRKGYKERGLHNLALEDVKTKGWYS